MRRHFEGAQFHQTQAAGRAIGRIKFVDAELAAMGIARHIDEQIAQDAVDEPGRHDAAIARLLTQLLERELDFVNLIVARFVDARRLTGRADEQAPRTDRTATDG